MRHPVATILLLCAFAFSPTPALADFKTGVDAYNRGEFATALRNWAALAENGDARAQLAVATLYMDGRGVEKAPKTALKWLVLAAQQGHVRAQTYLAVLYEEGYAAAPDMAEAHMWLKIAASKGDPLAALNLNRVAGKLTPAQRKETEQRALEWLMDHPGP